jgi:3-hydroxyisobutyrate dehydrogenase/2-hydroxy-3-oxopropionate reductase
LEPIGLIGAGVMGIAAAQRLLECGKRILVYDRSYTACERAGRLGADLATYAGDVAGDCRLILMFLPGPDEVSECVAGPQGILPHCNPGTVIVDMSTVDPRTTIAMAKLAKSREVGYLDAPVLGRPVSVGRWALPVGGAREDLNRCMEVLSHLATTIIHVGESGTGNKIKLLNQMMFGAINAMTAEMMAVSDKLGIPPSFLFDVITSSQAGTVSNLFRELGSKIRDGDYDEPIFSVNLLCKDVRLALQMAEEAGAPPLLTRVVQFVNEVARSQGLGDKDTSIMWKVFATIWGQPQGQRSGPATLELLNEGGRK